MRKVGPALLLGALRRVGAEHRLRRGAASLGYDGVTLVFCSTRPAAGETGAQPQRLWVAGWKGDGHRTGPQLTTVGGVTGVVACGPEPLADGSLLFHAKRAGAAASSDDDLFLAPPAR